jgi:hypothetical protein
VDAGGRWWTLRGRRPSRTPPAETTRTSPEQGRTRSPLTDSNRRPPPYHSIKAPSRTLIRRRSAYFPPGTIPARTASSSAGHGQREARPPSLRKSRSASVGAMAAARS